MGKLNQPVTISTMLADLERRVRLLENSGLVVSPPTVTGSRGGNAALASLLTKLALLGIIVDGTTA